MPELYWYQQEAVDAVERELDTVDSTLLVMATGLGKSVCIGELARRREGDVLVLADREELLDQMKGHLERATGERVEIEQADRRASHSCRIIVASLQTLANKLRRERLGLDRFSLVVLDEAHIGLARTYREVFESFRCKRVGVTATPDRGDKKGLAAIFKSVAYCMDIVEGIEHGYLVPIVGEQVHIDEIDLSGISTTSGDLVQGQLDEVMLRSVEGIVRKTLELHPEKRAIGFFPGVKSAEYATERANALDPGSTCFVSGFTDPNVRRETIAKFKEGIFRRLFNVGIASKGFDCPDVSLIIGARPTLSRNVFAQQAGRSTRVLPGLIQCCPGRDEATLRRHLIAQSAKSHAILLDFVGNSGKHRLVGPEDLLGVAYSEDEKLEAKKVQKDRPGIDVLESLAEARQRLQEAARRIKSRITAQVTRFNPFDGIAPEEGEKAARGDARFGAKQITSGQLAALKNLGVPDAEKFSQRQAKEMLKVLVKRRREGLATYRQTIQLKKMGIPSDTVRFDSARKILDLCAKVNWKPERIHVDLESRRVRLKA